MLNGVTIPNDGYILVSDVGEDDGGLLCYTDRSGCCRNIDGVAQEEWYFPEAGGLIPIEGVQIGDKFFYRNRDTGIVRLNHRGDPPERSRFHCEIPNAYGVIVTLYVNIGEWLAGP